MPLVLSCASQLVRKLSQVWFVLALLVILTCWLSGSFASRAAYKLRLLRLQTAEDLSIIIGIVAARALFIFCRPFIRVRHVPTAGGRRPCHPWLGGANWHLDDDARTEEERTLAPTAADVESSVPHEPRPRMILMNHTSFLDFFLISSMLTYKLIRRTHVRCVVASKLTELPCFGKGIGEYSGSFPVYFKSTEGGISGGEGASFSVEREKQEAESERMRAHVQNGGALAICPEGTVSRDPPDLQAFRHGSFKMAIEHGMPIWAVVFVGCNLCWPKGIGIGGYPCEIVVSEPVHLMTPTADMSAERVSSECRQQMQEIVNTLRSVNHAPTHSTREHEHAHE